jgi:hypothetical protein
VIKRLLILAAALVLVSASPAEAQYAPVTITVTNSAIPGGSITVTISSFAPGTNITIRVLPSGETVINISNDGSSPTTAPTTTTATTTTVPTTTTTEPTTTTTEPTTTTTEPTTTTTEPTTTTTEPTTTTTEPTTTTTEPTTTTTWPTTTTTRPRPPWGPPNWWGWWAGWGNPGGPSDDGGPDVQSAVLGTVLTDANGNGTATFPVPANVEPGTALIAASGEVTDGTTQTVQTETEVRTLAGPGESAAGAPSVGQLQPIGTSRSALPLGAGGAVLVVTGALAVIGTRRRRLQDTSA